MSSVGGSVRRRDDWAPRNRRVEVGAELAVKDKDLCGLTVELSGARADV
jgi:hypothetical protein